MCGRYSETKAEALLKRRFGFANDLGGFAPRYNIAPSQEAPVVVGEPRAVRMMRWGLVPYWAKDPSSVTRTINARAETAAERPSFEVPFRERRCLVLADGFYEWLKAGHGRGKVPMRFVLAGEDPFAFAGLWDAWRRPDGTELLTYTILTTAPNELVAEVHDRMPAVLAPEDEAAWLSPELSDPRELAPLLRPYAAERMEAYEVSPLVNSPDNDGPACVARVPTGRAGPVNLSLF